MDTESIKKMNKVDEQLSQAVTGLSKMTETIININDEIDKVFEDENYHHLFESYDKLKGIVLREVKPLLMTLKEQMGFTVTGYFQLIEHVKELDEMFEENVVDSLGKKS